MSKNYTHVLRAPISAGDAVLVRIDCNVPLNEDGSIADAFRLEAVTPTLELLKEKGARVVIAGAIGRPKGKRDNSLTTERIAEYFQGKVFATCEYVDEAFGDKVDAMLEACKPGDALVLENLRFWNEEESNDDGFAQKLSANIDFYVNDAFGQSHRNQASIVAITKYVPSFAGVCMAKEIDALESILESKEHPSVAIVGGAKVSDKLGVIEALISRCDNVLIGGAMAYTFLKAQGSSIGNSLCEADYLEQARTWMESGKVILPSDSIVADSIDSADTTVSESISDNQAGFDIGPESIERFTAAISTAKMILWNGPMGVFEKEQFARGTREVALAVSESDAYSVVGGGDSVAAIRALGLQEKIDHVSTGGGATLEYLEQSTLVGVDALVEVHAAKGNS
jgi:phosphoglycerate kinase